MKKEEFINLIESKGLIPKFNDQNYGVWHSIDLAIEIIPGSWGIIRSLRLGVGSILELEYPKTEADATEFFRILGI